MALVHTVLLLQCAAFIPCLYGKEYYAAFNGSVMLEANHSRSSLSFIEWKFYDKYTGDSERLIYQFGEEGTPEYGANFTEERVWMDYSTGNVNISQLGCYEDQTYSCEVAPPTETVATHTLVLGLPVDTPTVDVLVENQLTSFSPGPCESNPLVVTTDAETFSLTIKASVLSKPAVNFTLNGETLTQDCVEAGTCDGEVLCNVSTGEYPTNFTDIEMTIQYMNLDPWQYCIRPVKVAVRCECYEECAGYVCIVAPCVVVLVLGVAAGVGGFVFYKKKKQRDGPTA